MDTVVHHQILPFSPEALFFSSCLKYCLMVSNSQITPGTSLLVKDKKCVHRGSLHLIGYDGLATFFQFGTSPKSHLSVRASLGLAKFSVASVLQLIVSLTQFPFPHFLEWFLRILPNKPLHTYFSQESVF